MEKDTKTRVTADFDWIGIVVGAVISKLVEKILYLLSSVISRKLYSRKTTPEKRKSLLYRWGYANMHFAAHWLGVSSAEIKFAVDRAVIEYGFLKGAWKGMIEVLLYCFHNSD